MSSSVFVGLSPDTFVDPLCVVVVVVTGWVIGPTVMLTVEFVGLGISYGGEPL